MLGVCEWGEEMMDRKKVKNILYWLFFFIVIAFVFYCTIDYTLHATENVENATTLVRCALWSWTGP